MATKISSLKCNRFGGIRRINATFANELISASDLQNVELFNTESIAVSGLGLQKGILLSVQAFLLKKKLSIYLKAFKIIRPTVLFIPKIQLKVRFILLI